MEEKKELVSYNESIKGSREYLSTVTKHAILNGILSEADMISIQRQLWMLLGRQTERFTMGDSSSIPVETAKELLSSICYCISMYLEASDINEGAAMLKDNSVSNLFSLGQAEVKRKIDIGRELLHEVQESALDIDNISYHDTLKEITVFFKKYDYDYRFFAHEIPCMIDYQLCHGVPELQGIEYINEYLRRLIIENKFCRHFDSMKIVSLLQEYCPDYKEQLINIFEPVAANAIGLALLDKNVLSLSISKADRVELLSLFRLWTAKEALDNLTTAVEKLYVLLNIEDISSREYLKNTAAGLLCRIKVLKETECFCNLFLELHEQKETAPVFQYHDGKMMDDESLRRLIDEMQDCRHLSDKIAMVRDQIHSVRDLVEVLNVCFSSDEFAELFSTFSDMEIMVLLHFLYEKYGSSDEWSPDSVWEEQLARYVKSLEKCFLLH